MDMENFQSEYASMLAVLLTCIVSIAIIISFFFAVKSLKNGKNNEFIAYTPALLTSLGIFGTFSGIVIGLMAFDAHNIDGSIENLLSGLKTAFLTSLIGILLSIIFKVLQTSGMIVAPETEQKIASATPEDILGAIQQQSNSLKDLLISIGGNEDSSLISQVKLLRSDLNDNYTQSSKMQKEIVSSIHEIHSYTKDQKEIFITFSDKLWIKMQDFADLLSKSATETMIDALKHVISDFNQNLTEQFGDNFKELNNAVHALVTWQENYKTQMSEMTEHYKLGVTSITTTEAALSQITTNTHSISETMTSLKTIIEVNQQQLSELEKHLGAFKDMRDRAVEAIPEIKKQVDDTVKAISESAQTANTHSKKLLTDITDANKALMSDTTTIRHSVTQSIDTMQKHFETSLDDMLASQTQHMTKVFSNIDTSLEDQVGKTGEAVEKQLGMIDQSMQQELNRVMNEMGKALGQISNQFVKDYSKLVQQMHDIIQRTA